MKKKILILKNGAEKEIVSKNGKYYICKDAQFKFNSPMIEEIKEVAEKKNPPIEEAEGFNKFPEEKEEKPKKKSASKPKKKEGSDKK